MELVFKTCSIENAEVALKWVHKITTEIPVEYYNL